MPQEVDNNKLRDPISGCFFQMTRGTLCSSLTSGIRIYTKRKSASRAKGKVVATNRFSV